MKNGSARFIFYGLTAALAVLAAALFACSPGPALTTPPAGTKPTAVKLIFTTQPVGAEAGAFFTTQSVVAAVDINGNIVAGAHRVVTLAVTSATSDSSITLFGGTTMTSSDGVFSFKELSINKAGTFTLTATSKGLAPAVSDSLVITPIQGAKLVFSNKIISATAGSPFAAQPVVTVLDRYENTAYGSTAEVSLSVVAVTPDSYDAVLSGVTKVKAVKGAASFTGLSVDKEGTYVLMATGGSMTPTYSDPFKITPGTGVKLFFSTQPVTTATGSPLTVMPPAIAVVVQDAYGNVASSATADITVTITPSSGASGATLSGVTKIKAKNGIAHFVDLSIDKVGTGYTLTATSPGLAPAVSASFDITPPAPAPASSNTTAP